MSRLQEVAITVSALAAPGMKPKALIAAVKERHPGISKKDVVRAAFYALTSGAAKDPEQADRLHDFALKERGQPEESPSPEPAAKRERRRKKKGGEAATETAAEAGA
ncbi:hypothetical protein GCM10011390_15840 [Aureimonas endophytica]|uniref:Uncharacterized protein n=1 Tax=Aureimonas endophytica TaxID=2027858 RepID=A0A917E2R4_9HYPH|nr:hypothetical protein [Aureimonas endophytica]GGD97901.1 hypothetical protein GCM10011390_15840 [Aureimonas endophytica]